MSMELEASRFGYCMKFRTSTTSTCSPSCSNQPLPWAMITGSVRPPTRIFVAAASGASWPARSAAARAPRPRAIDRARRKRAVMGGLLSRAAPPRDGQALASVEQLEDQDAEEADGDQVGVEEIGLEELRRPGEAVADAVLRDVHLDGHHHDQ